MTAHNTEGMEVVVEMTKCAERLLDESGEPIENLIEETVVAPYVEGWTNIRSYRLKTGETLLICWIAEEKRIVIIEHREYLQQRVKELLR